MREAVYPTSVQAACMPTALGVFPTPSMLASLAILALQNEMPTTAICSTKSACVFLPARSETWLLTYPAQRDHERLRSGDYL